MHTQKKFSSDFAARLFLFVSGCHSLSALDKFSGFFIVKSLQ